MGLSVVVYGFLAKDVRMFPSLCSLFCVRLSVRMGLDWVLVNILDLRIRESN